MDPSPPTQAQPVASWTLLKELCALLLFAFLGSILVMPCLCREGAIAGQYKSIFFLLVLLRLSWSICRRTFRIEDYFTYFAILIAFCLWADALQRSASGQIAERFAGSLCCLGSPR